MSIPTTTRRVRLALVSAAMLAVLATPCCRRDEAANGATMAPVWPLVTDLGGGQYRVLFHFEAQPGTKTVHVAGTFNGWNPTSRLLDGPRDRRVFETTMLLPEGRHEYKFVVDGSAWASDPYNPHRAQGYQNSVLYLGIEPSDRPTGTTPHAAIELPGEVEHPPAVARLIDWLKADENPASGRDGGDWKLAVERITAERRMPLFTEKSVTFLYLNDEAHSVSLLFEVNGTHGTRAMQRLVEGRPVFALTLDRNRLPERAAYRFVVAKNEREETVLDPLAWSLTSRAGQPSAALVEASDAIGRIEVISDHRSSVEGLRPRDIYVYLPPEYASHPNERYPVLYMHDGQNCWDDPTGPFGHGGWCVNLTADRLIAEGKVRPFIAVGVANTPDRMREYGPGEDVLSDAKHGYIQYLKRDVKPMIDRRYRTLPGPENSALMGASMGGPISLQAVLLNPELFGGAACLSSALMFKDAANRDYFDLVRHIGKRPVRIFLDSEIGGGADSTRTQALAALLVETGWKEGVDFTHFEDAGAEHHNERAWRGRLERVLVFLFGPSNMRTR